VTSASANRADEVRQLSHDVKNALHGISVNLEVARTRAARGVLEPDALVPFLESAVQQLDTAVRLHKALAALATDLATSPAVPAPPAV
jgi:hypothetical protein